MKTKFYKILFSNYKSVKNKDSMKGLYWLILGLCVWFIPTIIFNVIVTSGESELTPEEATSDIPTEFVIVLFAAALPLILKGVITIRKERKSEKKDSRKDPSKNKRKFKKK